jgi:hypothetical protein
MKVVYKSIINQIDGYIESAQLAGREIECFELSKDEMKQLRAEMAPWGFSRPGWVGMIRGIKVKEVA